MSAGADLSSLRLLRAADSAAAALTAAERAVLGLRWADRAQNELATSGAFVEIVRALEELQAPGELVERARVAIGDERRHSSICQLAAEHYLGAPMAPPQPVPIPRAKFGGCSPRESSLLYVTLHCAINESIAAAYLRRCQLAARTDFARQATRDILEDEIRHARLGFSFLTSLAAADSGLVAEALPSLLRTGRASWLDMTGYPTDVAEGHGCLSEDALRQAVTGALAELVLPGFDYAGIDTAPARVALERDALTSDAGAGCHPNQPGRSNPRRP